MGFANFIMYDKRIAVSSLRSGEIPYADITDLPYIKHHRHAVTNNTLYTTANIKNGNTKVTWKEYTTGYSIEAGTVGTVFFGIGMETDNHSVTPKVNDMIIILGESLANDPLE
jgi:hypothetical protein